MGANRARALGEPKGGRATGGNYSTVKSARRVSATLSIRPRGRVQIIDMLLGIILACEDNTNDLNELATLCEQFERSCIWPIMNGLPSKGHRGSPRAREMSTTLKQDLWKPGPHDHGLTLASAKQSTSAMGRFRPTGDSSSTNSCSAGSIARIGRRAGVGRIRT
jgi:hypothetical protein